MKRFLILFAVVLSGWLLAQTGDGFGPDELAVTAPVVASGGGSCTLASGDTFNENFQAPGYENSWTNVAGTPDDEYALPGTSPCSGLSTVGFRANSTDGGDLYARTGLMGVDSTTLYHRFYIYVASESLGNNEGLVVYQCSETTDQTVYPRLRVYLFQTAGGQLSLYGYSTTATTTIAISTATWYRVEVMSVINSAANEFKVFAAAGSQVGSTEAFTTGNYWSRYIYAGRLNDDNAHATDVVIDGIGVDTSGYLGQ